MVIRLNSRHLKSLSPTEIEMFLNIKYQLGEKEAFSYVVFIRNTSLAKWAPIFYVLALGSMIMNEFNKSLKDTRHLN